MCFSLALGAINKPPFLEDSKMKATPESAALV
jgi:hypothetical protein